MNGPPKPGPDPSPIRNLRPDVSSGMVMDRIFRPEITGFFRLGPQNAHPFANIRTTIINRDLQSEIRSHKGSNILVSSRRKTTWEKVFFSIWFENATGGLEPAISPG
jgi:hypothetical protein